MAVSNYKLNTFDLANNRPKLFDSELLEIIFKEVRVEDLASPTNYSAADNDLSTHLAGIDAALLSAGGNEFADNLFRITDDGDNTKKIAFQASAITTATVRTITMPDADVDLGLIASAIQADGSVAFAANQPMGGFKLTGLEAGSAAGDSVRYEQAILITGANAFTAAQSMGSFNLTNVADPVGAQDAATKAYVDSLIDGRSWKQVVKAASTGNLTLSGEQTVDTVALVAGDRVLVKDQTDNTQNGIHIVSAGAWTRSTDTDSGAKLKGAAVFVANGDVNDDIQYAQTETGITVGSDPILWVTTSANNFSGHDMISLVGGDISVDLATNAGLVSTNPGNAAGQLQVNDDDATLERDSNVLRVKDLGISEAKLGAEAVTAGKIATNAVETAKINDDAVTAAKVNSDVAGFGVQQASSGALEHNNVRSLQNDDAGTFAVTEFGVMEADGNVVKVDAADALNLGSSIVCALESVATTATGRFSSGSMVISGFTGLAEESPVYLNRTTAGGYTQSLAGFVAGEHIVLLGQAVSATAINFEPRYIAEF